VVDITTWTENTAIGWHSNEGFKQVGLWTFKPKGYKTQVTFDMEYEFGGGIAGKLLGRAAEPIVRGNLQRSVETLKLNTEKVAGPRPAPKASTKSATKASAPARKSTTKPATKPAVQTRSRAKNSSRNP
jgi:uncharacterized membrane protein